MQFESVQFAEQQEVVQSKSRDRKFLAGYVLPQSESHPSPLKFQEAVRISFSKYKRKVPNQSEHQIQGERISDQLGSVTCLGKESLQVSITRRSCQSTCTRIFLGHRWEGKRKKPKKSSTSSAPMTNYVNYIAPLHASTTRRKIFRLPAELLGQPEENTSTTSLSRSSAVPSHARGLAATHSQKLLATLGGSTSTRP
jgi:hypothetical protein